MKVVICGGGNAAHAFAGVATTRDNLEPTVLTLFGDEAERWTNAMKETGFTVKKHKDSGETEDITSKPFVVTKDPKVALENCDVIVIASPSFAHKSFLEAIQPYVKPGMSIVGCPGYSGFELQVDHFLGENSKKCTLVSFETLPYACRISKFGQSVEILGTKRFLSGAIRKGTETTNDPVAIMQQLLGSDIELILNKTLIGLTLDPGNASLHPVLMYSQWKDWDGQPLDQAPLFYQGISKEGGDFLTEMNDELVHLADEMKQKYPKVEFGEIEHTYTWLLKAYPNTVADKSCLYLGLRTNSAYKGLVHPCKKTDDGKFLPDFKYRYLAEDIPYGTVIAKGIAELANVPTPKTDEVLRWAQEKLGKEYLTADGHLNGKDLSECRAPQTYGIKTLEEFISHY